MALVRSTTATWSAMIDRARAECNDPILDRAGNTIPTAQRKWVDADYTTSINDQLREMGVYMSGQHPGESMLYVDTTYGSGSFSITIPAAIGSGAPIVKVEHLTDPNRPERITYVSPQEIEDYASASLVTIVPFPAFRYTITAGDILIRPRPQGSAADIRIWYIAPPFVSDGTAGDLHSFTAMWPEYIMLGAALKLLRRDDEATIQQLQAYADLRRQFENYSNRQRAPQRIRRRRRGLS